MQLRLPLPESTHGLSIGSTAGCVVTDAFSTVRLPTAERSRSARKRDCAIISAGCGGCRSCLVSAWSNGGTNHGRRMRFLRLSRKGAAGFHAML